MPAKSPSEIARETLKLLAARRLAPTPENYRNLYDEVAGQTSTPPFPSLQLRLILRVLPAQTPGQKKLLGQLENAITQQDWSLLQNVLVGYANLGLSPVAGIATQEAYSDQLPASLTQVLARLVDNTLPALGEDDPKVKEMAVELSAFLRTGAIDLPSVESKLNNFSHRLSFAAEDQATIRTTLLQLLHLLFENIATLSTEDQWLHGQVEVLKAVTTPPLTLRQLDDVQQRMKDVIFKQSEARQRAVEAQSQMRELLATFIERLAQMDQSSSAYQEQLEECAERMGQATQIQDIMPLLEEVMTATRAMAQSSRISRGELQELRERVEAKHAEIEILRQELDRASAMARHDPLTNSLNRKGLDEALAREIARAQRIDSPLCLALLDIDNFKMINDRLGHAVGDQALVHLANVTRQVMRPQDQLARYGGEEFVILLPDTQLDSGVEAMRRLQRELTTRYFLQAEERLLITFSAGVTQVHGIEDAEAALQRADEGMYLAKRSGKNRVVGT